MSAATRQEVSRQSIQLRIDSSKTTLERNKLGQFSTPISLAADIVSFSLSLLPIEESARFLDPALGTGAFFSALLNAVGKRQIQVAQGFEIDPAYSVPARELWSSFGLEVETADFTQKGAPSEKYNLLVCNPPYVRHHHIKRDEKRRLQNLSKKSARVSLSGLAGLYCYFVAIGHHWLREGGIAAWLIPSEFMDVNYGRELKRYLLEEVTLIRVHRFDPADVQFEDALVSSAIVWLKREQPPSRHSVEFSFGGSLAHPTISRDVPATELRGASKWTHYPMQDTRTQYCGPTLSSLFDVKRGIATGSNRFFILSKEQIAEMRLPMECFRPILPSPRLITQDEIEADDQGNPLLPQALFLLDCRVPEAEVLRCHPTLWQYLESGKKEIGSRYLCNSRRVWYWQEAREVPPIVCTYMGRSDSRSRRPFRFLLNHSRAIAANTYLLLYPKPSLKRQLIDQSHLLRRIWEGLNDIPTETILNEGRFYGGGLRKMEPRELSNLPIGDLRRRVGLDTDLELDL